MESNSYDYTPQQYKKYNGQSVLKALRAIGNEATAAEIAAYISEDIGTTEKFVLPEIKQVLRRGITNGFLVRTGTNYSLIGEEENGMNIDSVRRQRKPSSSKNDAPKRRKMTKQGRKNVRKVTFDEEEKGDAEEDDQQGVEQYEEQEESEDNQVDLQVDSDRRRRKRFSSHENLVDTPKRRKISNPRPAVEQMSNDEEHDECDCDHGHYHTDSSEHRRKVKLYDILAPFASESEEEQIEQSYSSDDDEPSQKSYIVFKKSQSKKF